MIYSGSMIYIYIERETTLDYNIAETEIPRKIENFKAVKIKVQKNSS